MAKKEIVLEMVKDFSFEEFEVEERFCTKCGRVFPVIRLFKDTKCSKCSTTKKVVVNK
jgi:protein-arginine kinase activator protein McsA